jgi:putative heme-binding domain-containing protein
LSEDGQEVTLTADAERQAVELLVTLRTDTKAPSLHVSVATGADATERPLKPESLTVPWSPGPAASEPPPTLTPPSLAGGDARRGAAVFFSEEAKCSACHKFQGRGGEIGPDLTNLSQRDAASIFRDIAEPSAVIHPDYLPFTVSTFDGRVAVGVVRAEAADAIRVLDTNAQATRIPRDQIADLQPSRTSIMPVGLAGAIGEDRIRDLIAFLISESKGEK